MVRTSVRLFFVLGGESWGGVVNCVAACAICQQTGRQASKRKAEQRLKERRDKEEQEHWECNVNANQRNIKLATAAATTVMIDCFDSTCLKGGQARWAPLSGRVPSLLLRLHRASCARGARLSSRTSSSPSPSPNKTANGRRSSCVARLLAGGGRN